MFATFDVHQRSLNLVTSVNDPRQAGYLRIAFKFVPFGGTVPQTLMRRCYVL